jgi:thiamine transport system substrate-binding protein
VRGWRLALLLLAVAILVGLSGFYILSGGFRSAPATLTVYTYSSLFKYGDDPNATYDAVFGAFERQHGVKVSVKYFTDAGDILPALISEKNAPRADVVVGLTPVMVAKAKAEGVLQPYSPSGIGKVPTELVGELDPDHYATPYEFGLLALDVDGSFLNETVYPGLSSISYQELSKPPLASTLIVENPATSSVGQDFLLSTIVFYDRVLHEDWRSWWSSARGYVKVTPGWDEAFNIFTSADTRYHMVVSFATDPAYSAYFNYTMYQTIIPKHEGKMYGWLEIYGIGVVKGAPNEALAKAFVDWFIGDAVQAQVPLNEWMYPASSTVKLPDVFKYAIDPKDVFPLNGLVPPAELAQSLPQWLEDWQFIMAGSY